MAGKGDRLRPFDRKKWDAGWAVFENGEAKALRDGLDEAAFLIGPGHPAYAECAACGHRDKLRGMSKSYPFRPEKGGAVEVYDGAKTAVRQHLCEVCVRDVQDFLRDIKEQTDG